MGWAALDSTGGMSRQEAAWPSPPPSVQLPPGFPNRCPPGLTPPSSAVTQSWAESAQTPPDQPQTVALSPCCVSRPGSLVLRVRPAWGSLSFLPSMAPCGREDTAGGLTLRLLTPRVTFRGHISNSRPITGDKEGHCAWPKLARGHLCRHRALCRRCGTGRSLTEGAPQASPCSCPPSRPLGWAFRVGAQLPPDPPRPPLPPASLPLSPLPPGGSPTFSKLCVT